MSRGYVAPVAPVAPAMTTAGLILIPGRHNPASLHGPAVCEKLTDYRPEARYCGSELVIGEAKKQGEMAPLQIEKHPQLAKMLTRGGSVQHGFKGVEGVDYTAVRRSFRGKLAKPIFLAAKALAWQFATVA